MKHFCTFKSFIFQTISKIESKENPPFHRHSKATRIISGNDI